MLIKNMIRLAAVLCLFFFSTQMVQAQQLKGQELVDWISARTWILVEFTDTEGRTGTYDATQSLDRFMLKQYMSRFDGCNTCYSHLEFDIKNELLSVSNETCTEKHCLTELDDTGKNVSPKRSNEFVLRTPYLYNMHYKKDGEYLILTDGTGKYKLSAM